MHSDGLALDTWLATLRKALPESRRGRKEAGIHALRVATRRIDVWLRIAGHRVLRDDLHWLRGLAGPVRDLDVRIAARPPQVTALREARKEAQAALVAGLATGRADALVTALGLLPPISRARGERGVMRLARALLAFPCDPTVAADVHRRRRLLRRLRYGVELIGGAVEPLVALQDAYGAVCDAVVVGHPAAWLPAELAPPAADVQAPAGPPASATPQVLLDALRAADAAWQHHLPSIEGYAR